MDRIFVEILFVIKQKQVIENKPTDLTSIPSYIVSNIVFIFTHDFHDLHANLKKKTNWGK